MNTLKTTITTDTDNNKEIEEALFDILNEMEIDWNETAEYTLTIDNDFGCWIDGHTGRWFEDRHSIYWDFDNDDWDLPEGEATIRIDTPITDEDLEDQVYVATQKLCGNY